MTPAFSLYGGPFLLRKYYTSGTQVVHRSYTSTTQALHLQVHDSRYSTKKGHRNAQYGALRWPLMILIR